MKRFSLLRHAKSDWADRSLEDSQRPLNKRGKTAAPLIGAFMREHMIAPDLILCSSAVRTRQTMDLVTPHLKTAPEILITERLYLASTAEMLDEIKSAGDDHAHILMIGHNPGTHMLALDLIDPDRSETAAVALLAGKYPTAALAHFAFDATAWNEIDKRRGALTVFKTPKMLEASKAAALAPP